MGRIQGEFYIFLRKQYLKKSGKITKTWMYTINPASGLPDEIVKKSQRKSVNLIVNRIVTSKTDAYNIVTEYIKNLREERKRDYKGDMIFREYAAPFWKWETCPRVKRIREENIEGQGITPRYVKDRFYLFDKYIMKDPIADMKLTDINREQVLNLRSRLLEKTDSRSIVKTTMATFRAVIKEALFLEHIDRDPFLGVGQVKYKKTERGRFTREELKKLFAEIPGCWKELTVYVAFLTAMTTGMRRGEVLAMRWRQVDLKGKKILVDTAFKDNDETVGLPKWNKVRITPIPDRLVQALLLLQSKSEHTRPDDFVFCYGTGKRLGNTWWLDRFRAAMIEAKIPAEELARRHLVPHSLRHSLNSVLLEEGYDERKIRAALGWSDERVQEGYTHIDVEELRGQTDIIERLFE